MTTRFLEEDEIEMLETLQVTFGEMAQQADEHLRMLNDVLQLGKQARKQWRIFGVEVEKQYEQEVRDE